MKKIYCAKKGSPFRKDKAQEYGERLEYIQKTKKKSYVTVDDFLEDAILEESPFNEYIDWDNNKAGDSWRRQQARNLMNHLYIVVVNDDTNEPTPAFYSVVVTNGEEKKAYIDVDNANSNEDYNSQIVEEATNKIKSWIFRYKGFVTLKEAKKILVDNWEV